MKKLLLPVGVALLALAPALPVRAQAVVNDPLHMGVHIGEFAKHLQQWSSTVQNYQVVKDARGIASTLLVANPVATDRQLPVALHDGALARALAAAAESGVTGHDTTPFLLDFMQRETGGRSLDVNVEVYRGNVELGARIAVALATG